MASESSLSREERLLGVFPCPRIFLQDALFLRVSCNGPRNERGGVRAPCRVWRVGATGTGTAPERIVRTWEMGDFDWEI